MFLDRRRRLEYVGEAYADTMGQTGRVKPTFLWKVTIIFSLVTLHDDAVSIFRNRVGGGIIRPGFWGPWDVSGNFSFLFEVNHRSNVRICKSIIKAPRTVKCPGC
ncbi:hypothetical protein SKAU_G00145870 [Synaphobranchus kaupii]|uniref:Uncharacterized protein n=1 Tax=Synaphobranchus kaupii TaxID=118154 RepID=A0A9Q1FT27_SYNKA|nr:hypothetical protein SKAU_G00145870 [Synaphobranchus kaupii]